MSDGERAGREITGHPWLLVGATGVIGLALRRHLAGAGAQVLATSRDARPGFITYDLRDMAPTFPHAGANGVAVILAGTTNQADCERNPQQARNVNVNGVLRLAESLSGSGWRVIHISTDAVFPEFAAKPAIDPDGPPRSEYGRQKRQAEMGLLKRNPSSTVLRLSKVVWPSATPWVSWRNALIHSEQVSAFADYFISPITVAAAVQAVIAVGSQASGGIWQAGGSTCLSYYDFLCRVSGHHGWGGTIVSASRGPGIPEGFAPVTMSHTRLTTATGWRPPPLEAVIASFEWTSGAPR